MNAILFIHLITIGIWAGCVATEAVLEIALEGGPVGEGAGALDEGFLLQQHVGLGADAGPLARHLGHRRRS